LEGTLGELGVRGGVPGVVWRDDDGGGRVHSYLLIVERMLHWKRERDEGMLLLLGLILELLLLVLHKLLLVE
jgi:hypothetical protein